MQPKLSRREKIELLNAIQKGEIKPQDLQPPKIEFWYCFGNGETYEKDGKEYTKKEFEQYQKQQGSNTRFIILVECEGCEPIQEIEPGK